ncbi:unnamed protein product [Cuscuta epithymum]|uniref:Uncharacterized protein n=1 Tax=Cuscuta epithymum TaxID=186058 RepID=A0AAV0FNS5_9ASTE|nr:unnamed protein product [Cuscuta epithymum]
MMGNLKLADSLLLKCISSSTAMVPHTSWIYRGFVSSTRPSQKLAFCEFGHFRISAVSYKHSCHVKLFMIEIDEQTKVDKETCQRVVEAAGAVKEGAKEVKGVVQEVKEAVASGAGSAVKRVAEKAIEKAVEGEEEKGPWEKVKATTKAIKKDVMGDKSDSS